MYTSCDNFYSVHQTQNENEKDFFISLQHKIKNKNKKQTFGMSEKSILKSLNL